MQIDSRGGQEQPVMNQQDSQREGLGTIPEQAFDDASGADQDAMEIMQMNQAAKVPNFVPEKQAISN